MHYMLQRQRSVVKLLHTQNPSPDNANCTTLVWSAASKIDLLGIVFAFNHFIQRVV